MNLLLICCSIAQCLKIYKQGVFISQIISGEDVLITAPRHCIVIDEGIVTGEGTGSPGRMFTVIKPLRKMHDYEDTIERGIIYRDSKDNTLSDTINYPDFSAQILAISVGGFLIAVLFKLFG